MKIAKVIIPLTLVALIVSGCNFSDGQSANTDGLAADIYAQNAPSIVYIDTPTGTGSGIYIDGGYILTCAHVAWPFDSVRVVFPDGNEFDVDVINLDLMADIAVLGPVSASAPKLSLSSNDVIKIGDSVFIIGYPGEPDEYPQPSLSQGLISRLRYWIAQDLTYIQTDATTSGGASGGAIVSAGGEVIGMIGFTFPDVFGLGVSAADISSRVQGLIYGASVYWHGWREQLLYSGQTAQDVTLKHSWDTRVFVMYEPVGTTVDIEASSDNDIALYLIDASGYELAAADEGYSGAESLSVDTEYDAPYFLIVRQFDDLQANVKISSSCAMIALYDVDDGMLVSPGQTVTANIDCPGDWDYFVMDLAAYQTVTITVDSIAIDAYVEVGALDGYDEDDWYDDDSGGGLFGTNAELEFTAPQSGRYYISVSDVYDEWAGGYILTVE
ncbi:MAG: serine protease [Dehalococcoidia bacterium]